MQHIARFLVLVLVTGLTANVLHISAASVLPNLRYQRVGAIKQEAIFKPEGTTVASDLGASTGSLMPHYLLARGWSSILEARVRESERPPPILVPPKKRPSLRSPASPEKKSKFKSLSTIYKKTARAFTCHAIPSPTASTPGESSTSSSKYPPPPPNSPQEYVYGKLVSGENKKWLSVIRSKCNAVRYNVRWKKGGP